MKKQILRSVVLIMSFVMIFAFVPFLGGGQKAYAAVYQNCEWVERITEGLKWSYYDDGDTDTMAFASYPLYVDNYSVMDRLGYDDTSYMTNSVIQWIYKPSFEGDWDILEETPLDGSEDGLMTMPNNLSDYGRLEIDIYDAYKNDCYCSRIILVSPRKVKDLIDDGPCELSFKNGKKSLKGQNVAALLNTLRICASQKKIDLSVIENNQYIVDANKDGKTDFIIKTEFEESDDPDDLYNDSGCYIEVKTNMVDYGAKLLNIKPDPEGTFGKYRGKYELTNDWSYNCWIRLNLPEKKISKASSSLSSKTLVYSGKSLKPTVTVKDKGKTLKAGKDYKVSGSRKNVGKGTVTITGLGQYTGTKKLTFKVVPKGTSISSVSALYKGFKVVWKKQATQTSGYQVCYSMNSSFKDSRTKTVSGATKTSRSVTKLVGSKYYVKVRTYKTVSGVKYYSKWSAVKIVYPRR